MAAGELAPAAQASVADAGSRCCLLRLPPSNSRDPGARGRVLLVLERVVCFPSSGGFTEGVSTRRYSHMKRFGLILALAFPMLAFAHDVPDEVRIRAFLKPEGGQMRILVRIPANALIDILFPTLPDSPWLDLNRAGGFAEEGARTWVAPLVGLYEDDKRLLEPNVIAVRMTQMPDGDFATYEKALQHIHRDRSSGDGLFTQDEAAVDVELSTPIRSELSNFSIEPRFARVGVRV